MELYHGTSSVFGELKENNANHYLNGIYIGSNDTITDINYYVKNISPYVVSRIDVEGALSGNAIKHFKGIIDFVEGKH